MAEEASATDTDQRVYVTKLDINELALRFLEAQADDLPKITRPVGISAEDMLLFFAIFIPKAVDRARKNANIACEYFIEAGRAGGSIIDVIRKSADDETH